MSDSELSEASATPAPPDADLERALRREVVRANGAGEEFTLRTVRSAVEKKLGLSEGWFKNNGEWATKSKEIVHDQIDSGAEIAATPAESKRLQSDKKPSKLEASTSLSPIPTKRAGRNNEGPPKKRRKTNGDSSDEASSSSTALGSGSESESERKATKSKPSIKPKTKPASKKKEPVKRSKESEKKSPDQSEDNDEPKSDSEMSILIDEEPQTSKRAKKKDAPDSKSTAPGATKSAKPKANIEEDPDQTEIKRLQGWLVKCGIRKVWGKELKPFETPKAKIKHLKEMLSDAGMTGRFSVDKANQIKEARELAADIEAVQEGAERWGAENEDGDQDESSRPGRRLVRGAKNYDFLSSDGEETD